MKNTSTSTSTSTLYLSLLISTTLLLAPATTADNCFTVIQTFVPCLGFAAGNVFVFPVDCCSGLKGLVSSAVTTTDRQAICKCLKTAFDEFPSVEEQYLSQLPTVCHLPDSFPISLNTNCDKVHVLKSASESDGQEMNKREIN